MEKEQQNETLKVLLERISESKDGNAFDELYMRLQGQLFRYISSRVYDREAAKEVLHDVFVDLWQALQRFSYAGDEPFYGFVFTITKRKIYHHRKIATKHSHDDLEDVPEGVHATQDNIELSDDMRRLKELIPKLKESYRDVLELRYMSGLSFREIAFFTGCSEKNARVRHHRGLAKLKELYTKAYGG